MSRSTQIAAGLGAAIAFVLALMAAGALIVSLAFAAIGAALVAWIAYGVARRALLRGRVRPRVAQDPARIVRSPPA